MPVSINSNEKVTIELTINQLTFIQFAIQDGISLCNEKKKKSDSELYKKAQMSIADTYKEIYECISTGLEKQN